MAKILLIEDYKTARDLFQSLLTKKGYLVDTAVDGEDGLNKAKVGGYDLVLVDMVIPKISSHDLIQSLNSNPPPESNKVIALMYTTGSEPLLDQFRGLGITHFILKSTTDQDNVINNIERLLPTAS